jgi:hypothetical protein
MSNARAIDAKAGPLGQAILVWRFFRTHSWEETRAWFGSKDAPWLVQFAKYALCGVAADVTHNLITFVLRHGCPLSRGCRGRCWLPTTSTPT